MSSSLFGSFKSLKRMEKLFLGTVLFSCLLGIYFIFYFILATVFGILASVVTLAMVYFYLKNYAVNGELWLKKEIMLFAIMGVMIFHLPAYYVSSARIAHSKELKDESIIELDTFLLGWLFEKGQLSLYLDQNDYIGPHTTFGMIFNSILQVFYFLYYLIPYISIYAICLSRCIKETLFRKRGSGVKSQSYELNWNNLYFIFSVYNITYSVIFIINTLIPASSPRLFISELYEHPLNLKGFAAFLNKTCRDNKSANSFPSGHVGETICIAFCLFCMKKRLTAVIVLFGSSMIAVATLFLRYHYFCDLLAALSIAIGAFLFCYFMGYKNCMKESGNLSHTNISSGIPYTKEVEIA